MAITIAVVAGAARLLLTRWAMPMGVPVATTAALALGLAASASAASATAPRAMPSRCAWRAVSRTWTTSSESSPAGWCWRWPCHRPLPMPARASRWRWCSAACAAGAGWLLFDPHDDSAERGVFVTGTVALIGGGAAYVGTSPLLSGMVAGLCWRYLPGHADRMIADDLRRLPASAGGAAAGVSRRQAGRARSRCGCSGRCASSRLTGKLFAGWRCRGWPATWCLRTSAVTCRRG